MRTISRDVIGNIDTQRLDPAARSIDIQWGRTQGIDQPDKI